MNPYQAPETIDVSAPRCTPAAGRCPVCASRLAAVLLHTTRRIGTCPDCGSDLRKVLPLWVSLSTVLSYLCGFLVYFLLLSLNRFRQPMNFWEVYLSSVTVLILIPHAITFFLYRKHCQLRPAGPAIRNADPN